MKEIPIQGKMPELDLAIEAAQKAGQAIMEIYQTNFESKTKDDDSPITEADLASNRIIKEVLAKSGHYILSEEDADKEARLDEKTLWIVDPLDGTSDFIDKTGEFTVMIALIWDGVPVIGVINWPDGGKLFVAQKGKGSFRLSNGSWEKISVSTTADLRSSRAVGSRHHLSDKEKDLIERLGIPEFTSIGSSLKVCKISSGEADLYFTYTNKMSEWDSAASNCIVTEAGGKMTDMKGHDLTYNNKDIKHQNGIFVTNGILHEKISFEKNKRTKNDSNPFSDSNSGTNSLF
jgi:3'(2'), 5'-bisphosphate nucleotidase